MLDLAGGHTIVGTTPERGSIEGVKKPSRFVTAYGGSTIFLISMAWLCGLLS